MGERKLEINQQIVLRLPGELLSEALFSVPAWDKLSGALGYVRDELRWPTYMDPRQLPKVILPQGCKLPYEDHLAGLGIAPTDAFVLVSARNVGNNLRIVAWEREKGLLQLCGENAQQTARAYPCLCRTVEGALVMDRVSFDGWQPSRSDLAWALSGQPLVWEGKLGDPDEVLALTYDLRHVYAMPAEYSGRDRREERGARVRELITLWTANRDRPVSELAATVRKLAEEMGYPRELDYMHSAIGLSPDGSLVAAQMHGSFEDVGGALLAAGAHWAIELDEGGSVSLHLGGHGTLAEGRVFASHYFRPQGTALLVFRLHTDTKGGIPVGENSQLGRFV